jgi:MHS family proline/betaine transporter-like MFS transporter
MHFDSSIRSPLLEAIHDDTRKMSHTHMQTIAGTLGNVLEWYDFALFGFFSDIIAQLFFPPVDTTDGTNENLVRSFAVYGGAFIMRPVGGAFIGYLGDKYGRKYALVTSLFLMAVPTFAMGCLPTYSQIGSWSTVLLVLCRLLQGMSVGGQLPASLIYTVVSKR